VALYDQAAAKNPHPYMAHYRACSVLNNNGQPDGAIEHCNLAAADDPTQWEPHQMMGSIYSARSQSQDALAEYEKGIAAAEKMREQQPDSNRAKIGLGQMLNAQGNLLVQQKKYEDAIAAFTRAAESAVYPAMPYFNLCATYYNLKRSQEALAACDHAIASDPRLAYAYFIKASILFGQGQVDHGKYAVPPGTTEALNKYLENAPNGDHAAAVREMINQLNKPLVTTYSQPKK
jgi:tetratricopeptide (TPR) repeat protein